MNENTINNEVTMSGAGATLLAGRYRVVKQLGQGGMGSVWLAEDTKLDDHPVAIKMLPSILVSNKRAYVQVKREALVSLKLTHSNIAAVRAFEEENGSPFLVMDYIDGQTLDDCLAEKGTLTEEETIRLLKPVAAALDYAHTQGVVHRDVKPGNVMIRKDGVPFVLDFGIAREIQETITRVTGRLSSGTLMYMSPEQLHGAAPKPPQDVYSFAAMAYECLTGHPPFERGQIEYQIEHDAPAPLDGAISIAGGVTAGLAKSSEARPTTCAGVLTGGTRSVASVSETRTEPVVLGALADSEYDHVQAEIKRLEGILAQNEEKKKAEEEAKRRARELDEAKRKLAELRGRVEVEIAGFKPGDVKVVELPGGAKMEMVWCPAGSFAMGSPTSEKGRYDDEKQHRVALTEGFWMGKYEVTQAQWESVMGKRKCLWWEVDNNPSRFKGPDRPVENVSWEDCQKFIRKVNAAGKVRVSLPTEAQWEYACRAGTTTSLPNGKDLRILGANNGPALDNIAWYGGNSSVGFELSNGWDVSDWKEKQYSGSTAGTHPVGKKKANAWGLHDMIGNVWEWCSDWYGDYPAGSVKDPTGPVSGTYRVYRGGGWSNNARYCRSAGRDGRGPGYRSYYLGFRLVCSAGPRR